MENIKELFFEEKKFLTCYILKILMIIKEEFFSFLSRLPKVMGCSCALLGVIFATQILITGHFATAMKTIVIMGALSFGIYLMFLLLCKPFMNKIFSILEKVRTQHHNYNCGLYMQRYKINLLKENSLESMLSLKELLETNILLSGLSLKNKLIFDDNNSIDYKNILSNGLSMGTALCFSPTAQIKNKSFEENKEFVIENDAFIKNFSKFCEENPNDIEMQIEYLKENKRKIAKHTKK